MMWQLSYYANDVDLFLDICGHKCKRKESKAEFPQPVYACVFCTDCTLEVLGLVSMQRHIWTKIITSRK